MTFERPIRPIATAELADSVLEDLLILGIKEYSLSRLNIMLLPLQIKSIDRRIENFSAVIKKIKHKALALHFLNR